LAMTLTLSDVCSVDKCYEMFGRFNEMLYVQR
jgi:hypothetical protein